jgi:hypothetical protein
MTNTQKIKVDAEAAAMGRKALLESRLDRLGELLEEDEAAEKKRRR